MNDGKITSEKAVRRPAWTRALDVLLRTAHVAVTSVLFGGALCGVPLPNLLLWQHLAVATGCALILSEIYHCRHWPYQGRGIMAVVHLALLGLVSLRPESAKPLLTAALVFGMVGSHMPKHLRYWSFVHGRVMLSG